MSNFDLPSEFEIHSAQKDSPSKSKAIENLIIKTAPFVITLCNKWCRPPIESQDVSQEALLTIAHKIKSFKGDSAYSTWIYTISYRTFLDQLKKEQRRKNIVTIEHLDDNASDSLPLNDSDNTNFIYEAIEKLDEDQRNALLMIDLMGYDYQHAADELSIPIGTLRSRLARARINLEKILKSRN
ncbi:MAG: RNA polymerase sigma factor [Acidimicrobiia bacterium]